LNVTFPVVLALGGALFGVLLSLVAIFLILLVLVQRGRGGGLAGALGGMGGSSAFGAKAGDVFTRITIVAAAIWIILCIAASRWGSSGAASRINVGTGGGGGASTTTSATLDEETDGQAADGAADAETPAADGDSAESGETGTSAPTDLGDVPGSDTPATAVEPPAEEGAEQ
jgi:preprotein translocase subunit SecG